MAKSKKGGKSQSELASSFSAQNKSPSVNTNTLAGILKASGQSKAKSSLFGTNKVNVPKPKASKPTDASKRATGNKLRAENRAKGNVPGTSNYKPSTPTRSSMVAGTVTTPKKETPSSSNPKVSSEPEQFFDSYASSSEAPIAQAAIKTAPIDTVEFVDEALSAELLLELLFEDVGGQELLTIARNDTVNGQDVAYQPFKNLGILQEIYSPTNLLKLQETSDKLFSNFTINLRDKIPKIGNGLYGANYYLDLEAGDGIIEFVNLKSDEQVEIQIASAGIIEDVGI